MEVSSGGMPFSRSERLQQLNKFAEACADLAARFDHRDPRMASTFRLLSVRAADLLMSGFTQDDLAHLTRGLPASAPDWLNPKALDAGVRQEPWQQAIAGPWARARQLALDLRTITRS